MEKSIYEDYYSVEKDFSNNYEKLQAEQEEELNQFKKNLKGYKENGLLKLYDEQKERQKELERKLSEGLDFAVKEAYFENDTYNKMKDKFPEISKQLETNFKMNANQQDIKEDNLRRYDGIIKTYNKEYPEVKQELGSFGKLKQWSKENKKAIETGQKILSGAALVINPVTAVAVRGVMAIMKTKPMKEFSKSLSNNVSNGLDKLGIKKDSKLRTGLRLAKTAVVMGGIVGDRKSVV